MVIAVEPLRPELPEDPLVLRTVGETVGVLVAVGVCCGMPGLKGLGVVPAAAATPGKNTAGKDTAGKNTAATNAAGESAAASDRSTNSLRISRCPTTCDRYRSDASGCSIAAVSGGLR